MLCSCCSRARVARHGAQKAVENWTTVRSASSGRTPTLFYLGRDGSLIGRSSGAPRPDELTALVNAHAGTPA